MTRRELIRMLYIGGQAAIGAELIAIAGILIFLLFYSDVLVNPQGDGLSYLTVENFIEEWQDRNILFGVSTTLILGVPTFAMMIVVWAWHLYFESEGVRLMNWVASSLAIIGGTLMVANVGITIWSFGLLYNAYLAGDIGVAEIYVSFGIAEGLQVAGMFTLYVIYPVMLSFASWQRRLLPNWFLVVALLFVFLNDLNFLSGGKSTQVSLATQGAMVLWPFLMGVVLLSKANALNQQHSTTPH